MHLYVPFDRHADIPYIFFCVHLCLVSEWVMGWGMFQQSHSTVTLRFIIYFWILFIFTYFLIYINLFQTLYMCKFAM